MKKTDSRGAPRAAATADRRTAKPEKRARALAKCVAAAEEIRAAGSGGPAGSEPLPDAQQERFCQAVLVERSAMAAAVKAGYAPGSARARASLLLARPKIRLRVAHLLNAGADKRIMRKNEALELATRRARASIVDIVDLLNLDAEEFARRVKTHPAAPAIRYIKFGQTENPDGTPGPRMVQYIELFNPRDSSRFIAEVLGWAAPEDGGKGAVNIGALVLPAETNETVEG